MTLEIIIRYFHFIGIFSLFAGLVAEHLLIGKSMTRGELKRLSIVDSVYGASSAIVLISGLLLWFVVGKPADFYTQNAVFHTKILLFVITALLSIYPTLYLIKQRKGNSEELITLPKSVVMIIRVELLILAIIPLLAVFMSKGVGSFAG